MQIIIASGRKACSGGNSRPFKGLGGREKQVKSLRNQQSSCLHSSCEAADLLVKLYLHKHRNFKMSDDHGNPTEQSHVCCSIGGQDRRHGAVMAALALATTF